MNEVVTTSGVGSTILGGLPIGEVQRIEKNELDSTNKIYIRPLANMDNLIFVTVVKTKITNY